MCQVCFLSQRPQFDVLTPCVLLHLPSIMQNVFSNNNRCLSCRGGGGGFQDRLRSIRCIFKSLMSQRPLAGNNTFQRLKPPHAFITSLHPVVQLSSRSSWCWRGQLIVGRCRRPLLQSLCVISPYTLVLHPFPVCLPRGVNR